MKLIIRRKFYTNITLNGAGPFVILKLYTN